jgi:hypothetical protein
VVGWALLVMGWALLVSAKLLVCWMAMVRLVGLVVGWVKGTAEEPSAARSASDVHSSE